jgi:hypothetical protein
MTVAEACLAVRAPRPRAPLAWAVVAAIASSGPAVGAHGPRIVGAGAVVRDLPDSGALDPVGHPDARAWPHGMVIGTPAIDVAMVIRPPAIDPGMVLRSAPFTVLTGIPMLDNVLSGLLGPAAWPGA